MKLEHNDHLTLHLGWEGKETLKSYLQESVLLFIYLFSFMFITWRLITLQYCSGFCHTLTWISHGFTCVSHPSGSSQCTSPENLSHTSNLDPNSILVSMLFSQNIPLLPSPTESKSLLCTSVSFPVLHIGLSLPSFKIPYICISILYWSLCFWLTSLCIMGSSFIHLIRTDSN